MAAAVPRRVPHCMAILICSGGILLKICVMVSLISSSY